jgi:hypothetical protein
VTELVPVVTRDAGGSRTLACEAVRTAPPIAHANAGLRMPSCGAGGWK